MAELKKYLDTTALGTLVDQIKAEDAKVLQGAKDYADGLAKNYEASGAAATAESNAKAYTDLLAGGAVKANTDALAKLNGDASTEGSVAKAIADAKALIDADVDAVEAIANQNKTDIAAINNAESGILAQAKKYTDDEVAEVQGNIDTLASYVGTLPEGTTATNVIAYVQEKTTGIASEGAMTELGNRVGVVEGKVAAIEGDYLKGADKTELEGKITAVQNAVDGEKTRAEGIESGLRTDVDAIKNDYLKGADKTALSDAIGAEKERAMGVEGGLDTRVKAIEDDYLTSADKSALQTQIDTIMNNPDTEGVINSINEFTQYIEDHGEIAEGFRTDIDKNKEDIAALNKAIGDHEALAAETYATKTELADEKKALQDEIDADVKVVADKVTTLEGAVATKAEQSALNEAVAALQGEDTTIKGRLDAVEAMLGDGDNSVADMIAAAKAEAIAEAKTDASNKDAVVLAESQKYVDAEIDKVEVALDTLQGVVDGKAAASDLTTVSGKVTTLEGKVSTLETDMDAVEGKASANETAIGTLNTTVAGKASQADLDNAVGRIAQNESDIETLEGVVADKAEQDDLDTLAERVTAAETAIASNTSAINSFTPITSAEVEALFA